MSAKEEQRQSHFKTNRETDNHHCYSNNFSDRNTEKNCLFSKVIQKEIHDICRLDYQPLFRMAEIEPMIYVKYFVSPLMLVIQIHLNNNVIILSGKSMIGGRKALENRRFIKHLTSGQYSSGFSDDINNALNKIMTGNKLLADKNKEKRKVIKQQTKETWTSLKENILLAKVS